MKAKVRSNKITMREGGEGRQASEDVIQSAELPLGQMDTFGTSIMYLS